MFAWCSQSLIELDNYSLHRQLALISCVILSTSNGCQSSWTRLTSSIRCTRSRHCRGLQDWDQLYRSRLSNIVFTYSRSGEARYQHNGQVRTSWTSVIHSISTTARVSIASITCISMSAIEYYGMEWPMYALKRIHTKCSRNILCTIASFVMMWHQCNTGTNTPIPVHSETFAAHS